MAYNGSGTGNITTVLSGVNELTQGLFGFFLLIAVFSIVYYFNRSEPTRESLTGATFVTMVVAIFGRYLGIVTDIQLGTTIVLFIGALVMLINRN